MVRVVEFWLVVVVFEFKVCVVWCIWWCCVCCNSWGGVVVLLVVWFGLGLRYGCLCWSSVGWWFGCWIVGCFIGWCLDIVLGYVFWKVWFLILVWLRFFEFCGCRIFYCLGIDFWLIVGLLWSCWLLGGLFFCCV